MNYLNNLLSTKNSLYFQLGYVQFDFLKVWATVAPDGQVWQNRFWHFLSILWLHIFHAVIKFRILLFEAFLTSKNPDSGISLYRLIPQGFLYEKPSFFNSPYSFYIFYGLLIGIWLLLLFKVISTNILDTYPSACIPFFNA